MANTHIHFENAWDWLQLGYTWRYAHTHTYARRYAPLRTEEPARTGAVRGGARRALEDDVRPGLRAGCRPFGAVLYDVMQSRLAIQFLI